MLFWDSIWLALTYLAVVVADLFQAMRVVYLQGICKTVWKLLLPPTGHELLLTLTIAVLAMNKFCVTLSERARAFWRGRCRI